MKYPTRKLALFYLALSIFLLATPTLALGGGANEIGPANRVIAVETEQELPPFMPIPSLSLDGKPAPKGSSLPVFASKEEDVKISLFAADESHIQLTDYPVNEFWVLLEGKVSFTGKSGDTQVFEAGDYLIIPKGYTGTSQVIEKMKKLSVSF